MELENIISLRKVYRTAYTKLAKKLEKLCSEQNPNLEDISAQWTVLQGKELKLREYNDTIIEKIASGDCTEESMTNELNSCESYEINFAKLTIVCNNLLHPKVEIAENTFANASNAQRKFKLPVIEFTKFTGDVREWLAFWAQFNKIHTDNNIDPEDKFQYLLQATLPGSRARVLVESFPPTKENYDEAIKCTKKCTKLTLDALYDQIETKLRALETLGVTTEKCTAMLFPLVESCLPEELLRVWQRTRITTTKEEEIMKERLDGLMKFLKNEVENEARITMAAEGFGFAAENKSSKTKPAGKNSIPTAIGLLSQNIKCVFCDKSHKSDECFKARKMLLEQKRKILTEKRLCFNCLKAGHQSRKCQVRLRCAACDDPHYAIMCPKIKNRFEAGKDPVVAVAETKEESSDIALANYTNTQVLLQTLRVTVIGEGTQRDVRALIDSGSQRSYITKNLASKLCYKPKGTTEIVHSLFGGVSGDRQIHNQYEIRLANSANNFRCHFDVLDQKSICSNVPAIPQGEWMQELKLLNIGITDVLKDGPIEVLIGADVSGKLLTGNKKDLKCGLVAIETRLGWTLQGKASIKNCKSNLAIQAISLFSQDLAITDLWRLDVLGITDPVERHSRQQLEEAAKEYFKNTTSRNKDGRYVVNLPWIEGHPVLPDNYDIAEKRLHHTVKKLEAQKLLEGYHQVFEEWLQEGIIEEIQRVDGEAAVHYLPHRAVVKMQSSTTKLRPVFDASAHGKNQPSLNHCLEKGPNLIELIPNILMKFRMHRIGVTADIKRAFLQIEIRTEDRDFLRFLWIGREGDIKLFRHCRVVFGVNASPFLLGATLKFHLQKILMGCEDNQSNFTKAIIQKLSDSFYVDNCVASVEDEAELIEFMHQASKALNEGLFELRGWEHSSKNISQTGEETPVLGLSWNRHSDTLSIQAIEIDPTSRITKRYILSQTQRIYDPVGFTCPTTLVPKLLLQELWKEKVGWDYEVDDEIKDKFLKWQEESSALADIRLPRWMNMEVHKQNRYSLHVFSDASQHAYATVIFLRVETEDDVHLHLVTAKARVAPLKAITIPRLELLGATIAARLYAEVKSSLSDWDFQTYFWSDSSPVLCWIQNEENWSIFVGNRVKEIRTLTEKGRWRHVAGRLNPADLPSRGCNPSALVHSQWWQGPDWLRREPCYWPTSANQFDEVEVNAEKKQCVITSSAIANEDPWYGRYFSQYTKIVRHVAWIHRFVHNSKRQVEKRVGELTTSEVSNAELNLFKLIQKDTLNLKDKNVLELNPFIDENGVIRLQTKITYRDDFRDFREPLLLPARSVVVECLIMSEHIKACHAGTHNLLNILRERFWILSGRKTVRKVIKRCSVCRRVEGKHFETLITALPRNRVKDACAFEVTGVDFAGPLYLKNNKKTWVCLFTCGIYRAIHLEIVHTLSTNGFLQAFRRFVARRGRPQVIYSDNGTNFCGANNLLSRVDWQEIERFSATQRIRWKFNPPSAPWWGGWWERLVRSVKQLLKKVLGRAALTYEELLTVICDCEAVINARPITYLSNSPGELVPLSPQMFLRDQSNGGVEDFDQIDIKKLQGRARYRQLLMRHLRKRFRSEYLGQLRQVQRNHASRPISVGEVVLVEDSTSKRIEWPLGRVEDVIPGRDGQVRLARVKTSRGAQLLRAVQRLYPLEADIEPRAVSAREPSENVQEPQCEKRVGVADCEMTCPFEKVSRSGRIIRCPKRLDLFCK